VAVRATFTTPIAGFSLGKLILLVLVFALAWWLLKKYSSSITRKQPPQARVTEDMVRCEYCGVHLPRSESHASSGKFFCSEDHLRLHR
jgi:uncharacterized protein